MNKNDDCLFCMLQNNKELIILENSVAYVIKDKFPAREGHLLIITKNHYKTVFHTPLNVRKEMMELMEEAKD